MNSSPAHPHQPWRIAVTRLLALASMALALTACDVAITRQPIGAQPANLADLKVEGTWKAGSEHFFVRVADEKAGKLEIAQVKSEGGEFTLERTELLVRRQDDVLLVNFRPIKPEMPPEYVFGRAAVNDGSTVIYLAAKKPIAAFAKSAGLGLSDHSLHEGDNDHDSVVITNGFERLAQELASPAGWRLLDMEHPLILQQE
ncbi:MAG: hypothetical protein IT581_03425 [Verrucomicrobiales bacterium]|nr:hypothetical protein [Verrucomicrobiales bacterium]